MRRIATLLLLSVLAVPAMAELRGGGHVTGRLPDHDASNPAAAVVTSESLLANEGFWPFQAKLVAPWVPPGRTTALPAEIPGVLIRVEEGGRARIDFGRDGLYDVPLAETDLVEGANQVRLGTVKKLGPNFLYMVAPRLLDGLADPPAALAYTEAARFDRFLLVFAEPEAEVLEPLAAQLAPLGDRERLLVIFFPQGRVPDATVHATLREIGWPVAFLYDHMSEGYTRTLLDEGTALPAVVLVTAEGRLLFQEAWGDGTAARLAAAVAHPGDRSETAAAKP